MVGRSVEWLIRCSVRKRTVPPCCGGFLARRLARILPPRAARDASVSCIDFGMGEGGEGWIYDNTSMAAYHRARRGTG